ncbi:hypothetical protein GFJ94_01910 [Flavobacterium sp. LMO8]|uniref:aspartyl protease family protein n=1 Tax=Flavobacterium sp. LMO8 TaxID=2654244 RepID=UPI00129167A9|nr:aspartyl protease family protein [Flavobacterium sp. LMO8]MQP23815.1 hypothetical protein [Flavobacterium sp. LMO8]
MRNCIQILLYILSTLSLSAQSNFNWNSKKDKIKIPFELTHNLIILDVDFNGVPLKMIADTGAEMNILFSFPDKDSIVLSNTEKIQIKGVGKGNSLEAYLSKSNKVKIKEYEDLNFEIVLIPNQDISIINKLGIPVNGILGSSFFKQYLVEINYQKKQIILHKNKLLLKDKRIIKFNTIAADFNENKPYIQLPISLNADKKNVKLLFDTGLGDGLWLFENDSLKCKNDFFVDLLGVGLSGEIFGKRSRIEQISFDGLILKDALVSYPDSLSFNQISLLNDRNGSLGGDIIKRFNWFLDYENKQFYFKKNTLFNSSFEYNMSGIEIQHSGLQWVKEAVRKEGGIGQVNMDEFVFEDSSRRYNYNYELKPIFQIYAIRKNSPGEKAGLLVGDKILKINNKIASQLSIQNITDLFQSEEGKWITMIVDRAGIRFTVKFQLEKIL